MLFPNGTLTKKDNYIAVANSVLKINTDTFFRLDLIHNADKDAQTKFDIKRVLYETVVLYNNILVKF